MSVPKTIYGDGQHEVAVDVDGVTISEHGGQVLILSHAAFREIVLGFERWHEMREEEG